MKRMLFVILSIISCQVIHSVDIFKAIESNNKKEIAQWLKVSSNLDMVNDQGQTVLIKAVCANNRNLVCQLLKNDVLVNIVDQCGRAALDYAVELNNKKMARMLVKARADVTTEGNAVRCRELVVRASPWRIFAAIALSIVLVCFLNFVALAFCITCVLGCLTMSGEVLVLPLVIESLVVLAITGGFIYGIVKLGLSECDCYPVRIIQPVA